MDTSIFKKRIMVENLDARLDELSKIISFLLSQKSVENIHEKLANYLDKRVDTINKKIEKLQGMENGQ